MTSDAPHDPLSGLRAEPDPRDPRASALLRPPPPGVSLAGRVAIVGLPYDGGIPSRPGARFGPNAIRGALSAFGTLDDERVLEPVADLGDAALPTMNASEAHRRIEETARRAFAAGARPVFLGGDHGCTGSVIRGLAAARPQLRLALLNVDAHLDVREYPDAESLTSGTPFRRAMETEILDGRRVGMVGLRRFANSPHYLGWAAERGVRLWTVEAVGQAGAGAVGRDAVASIGEGADALYLSVDVDAVDVAHAPGVSAQGIGGLSAREAIELVRTVAADPRLVGADVMETSPPLCPDGRTARLAARLVLEIVAAMQRHTGDGGVPTAPTA